MDPLIDAHITTAYTPEIGVCMYEAFALFSNFDIPEYEQRFVSLLVSEENMHKEDLADGFRAIIVEYLDMVLTAHHVYVTETCGLRHRVNIVSALYDVQNRDDYTILARGLESDESAEEKLAFVVSELTSVPVSEILEQIDHVEPLFIDKLYAFCTQHEKGTDDDLFLTKEVKENLDNLRKFKQFLNGDEPLGISLLKNGAIPNQPFTNYLPYIDSAFEGVSTSTNPLPIAKDVLSLLYLSGDGRLKPFDVYRTYSTQLFDDPLVISKVDVQLLRLVGEYNGFLQALKNEKV